MNPDEFEDLKLAANMANNAKGYFRERFAGNDPRYLANILPDPKIQVDPRKIIARDWRQSVEQVQQLPQFQPQAPQQVIPYGMNIPDPNQIGSKPLIQRIPKGMDEHGNTIYEEVSPTQILGIPNQQPVYQQPPNFQSTGFQLPQFGTPKQVETKPTMDIEEKFDWLVKEIKSLRSSINKLTRQLSPVKLKDKPSTSDSLETTDQS
jgi:hypothetical protein